MKINIGRLFRLFGKSKLKEENDKLRAKIEGLETDKEILKKGLAELNKLVIRLSK
jgi:hypothetical protein